MLSSVRSVAAVTASALLKTCAVALKKEIQLASNPDPLPYERERRAWYPLSAHAPITGHGCYEYNYKLQLLSKHITTYKCDDAFKPQLSYGKGSGFEAKITVKRYSIEYVRAGAAKCH